MSAAGGLLEALIADKIKKEYVDIKDPEDANVKKKKKGKKNYRNI
jgi:hypothetical protein